jgi:hypothetical protein
MSTATLAGVLLSPSRWRSTRRSSPPAVRFDDPDILRRPTDELLERYRQGGTALVLVWWAFALTAVLFAPLVVLLPRAVSDADATLLAVGVTVGCRESVATP